jgi:uncharacterized DUF497 family protein
VLIFEWDAQKAQNNEQKHGVSFVEASEVFDDDHSSAVLDPDHSADEARYLRRVQTGQVLGCVLY